MRAGASQRAVELFNVTGALQTAARMAAAADLKSTGDNQRLVFGKSFQQ